MARWNWAGMVGLLCLAGPLAGRAQNENVYTAHSRFSTGTYVLAESPTVRRNGLLKLRKTDLVSIQGVDGKKTDYTPEEVISFQLGKKRFFVEKDIVANKKFSITAGKEAYVELLDSGQVMLMRGLFLMRNGGTPMPGGMMGSGGQSYGTLYLIRRPQDLEAIAFDGDEPKVLLPYLLDRPDLARLANASWLDKDQIEGNAIFKLVHALNTGRPYVPPLTHYEQMKRQALEKQAHKAAAQVDTTRH